MIGSFFPREILGMLPQEILGGKLVGNRFFNLALKSHRCEVPMQLLLFVAINGDQRSYKTGECVYMSSDHPWSMFLVISGVFAHIAQPSDTGGVTEIKPIVEKLAPPAPKLTEGR